MQSENRVFDDLARLFGSALGTFQDTRVGVEEAFRQRLERVLLRMDMVSREEFDAVRAMAEAARAENERLAARLAQLEAQRGAENQPAPPEGPAEDRSPEPSE